MSDAPAPTDTASASQSQRWPSPPTRGALFTVLAGYGAMTLAGVAGYEAPPRVYLILGAFCLFAIGRALIAERARPAPQRSTGRQLMLVVVALGVAAHIAADVQSWWVLRYGKSALGG